MGLDIYAGPICRYVAGNWMTIVQQAGDSAGVPVKMIRPQDPPDAIRDMAVVEPVVARWRDGLIESLGLTDPWDEDPDAAYATDKPDWDGYGAVVLLAAYDEQPSLSAGRSVRSGPRRSEIPSVPPRAFAEAPAFKAAAQSPSRYPTLLLGVEWCLPLPESPTVFEASTPNGMQKRMGRIDALVKELTLLNKRTLRLDDLGKERARQAGPPDPGAPIEAVAPFGLSVLLALAEYALEQRVAWILDY